MIIAILRITTAARTAAQAAMLGAASIATAIAVAGAAHSAPPLNPGTAASGPLYGDPTTAAAYWQPQSLDDCGLMAVADVVGELTGHLPTEHDIITVAGRIPSVDGPGPIYTPPADPANPGPDGGVGTGDQVKLLAHYGIHAVLTDRQSAPQTGVATGISALQQYLASGRKVIVNVNAETIWNQTDGDHTSADHVVVVTGIDTANGVVHLNDSGTDNGRDEQVPIGTFLKAWNTSNDQMIVTQESGNQQMPHPNGS